MPITAPAYDHTGRLLLTPDDPDAALRAQLHAELGLAPAPVPDFDAAARELAAATGAPQAMVTLVGVARQYFAGLHLPPGEPLVRDAGRDHGFCPHVVVRRRALALDDVRDYPRFSANPVVDEAGIRSYLGAPLMDPSGVALGTLCAQDRTPRPWDEKDLRTVKDAAAELTRRILARRPDGPDRPSPDAA
ncbi:GAF domain-containing protein [Streptomyces sp. 6N223]|uniref:GAF domain-containing protein n=1 Tax=Streptomyces sp. 6N223 TaxID=3457412 RepID=UPI003FD4F0BC